MSAALSQRVAACLREHHVMTLATQGETGLWAAAVFYVNEGLKLYFLSSPASRHASNLAREPRVAVTIQRDYDDWPQITGIQAEGEAVEVSGDEHTHARSLYGDKFPLVGRAGSTTGAIAQALAKVHWYRFTPRRLYLIDNSLGFGHRDELDCRRG